MTVIGEPPEPAVIPHKSIREEASTRQFVLGYVDPAVAHVSAEVFWSIWRDGGNFMMHRSAMLAQIYRECAEEIMFMAQAERAAPQPLIAACLQLLEETMRIDDAEGFVYAITAETHERIRRELECAGYVARKDTEDGS